MSDVVRQACILVGGKGTRLGRLTRETPKPLLTIGGRTTFLDVLIEQVARQGFDDVVLLAGHLGHLIQVQYDGRRFGACRIRVLVEPEPRGTAGALISAQDILAPQFLLLNGDSFFDVNMRALAAEASQDEALIALRYVPDASRYGTVELKGNRILRFCEKSSEFCGPALINAGIYVLQRSILGRISKLPCSIENDIFPALAAEGRLDSIVRDGYFLDIGLPETLDQGRRELMDLRMRPAAFLDRDGVINVDSGYVYRPEQIEWIAGARESIRRLNDLGFRVIVVTNQAGIGHGYYEEKDVLSVHSWVQEELAHEGAFIDAFYYCPYHPKARVEKYRSHHANRKPGSGMILQAMADLPIRKNGSFLIGDKDTDVAAALGAGIPGFLFRGSNLAEFLDECLPRLERKTLAGDRTGKSSIR